MTSEQKLQLTIERLFQIAAYPEETQLVTTRVEGGFNPFLYPFAKCIQRLWSFLKSMNGEWLRDLGPWLFWAWTAHWSSCQKKKRCNVRLSKDIYVEIRLSPQLENSYAVIQMLEEQVCANSCCIGSWWPDIACRSPAASDATLHFWVKNAECSEGRGETQTSPRRFAHLNCCNWGLDTQSLCPQRTSFPCIEGYSKARSVMLESFTCDGIELQKWWCIISDGVNTSSQQKMVFCFDAFPSHDHLHTSVCLSHDTSPTATSSTHRLWMFEILYQQICSLSHVYPCIFSAFSHQQCDFRDVSDLNNFHGYPLVNLHSKLQEIPIFHREMCHLHSGSIFHITFTERRRHLLTSHRSSPLKQCSMVFSDAAIGSLEKDPGRKKSEKKSQLEGLKNKI